jgi:hypothetical protein
MNSHTVNIDWISINEKSYLQFTFEGHLSESMADQAIVQWKDELNKFQEETKTDIIYQCTNMTGFDTNARRNWQNAMSELRNQLGEIWIVSCNIFILTAARTMGVLTGFNIKATKTIDEIR